MYLEFFKRLFLFFIFLLLVIMIYALIYRELYRAGKDFKDIKDDSDLSFFYFSVVTASTTGYGDITPTSVEGRILVSSEILIFLISILAFTVLNAQSIIIEAVIRLNSKLLEHEKSIIKHEKSIIKHEKKFKKILY